MTVLIIVAAVLVAAFLGWPLTALVLKLARKVDPVPLNPVPADAVPPDAETTVGEADVETAPSKPKLDSSATTKVLRGGLTIGILERIAVVLCIAFDQPVAIAYVVAVKGLGRYPELKDTPAASERFIIGTLASLIWAAVIGVLARWLIGRL